MSVRPLVVAAALLGACATSFLLAALAFASGSRGSAVVTLQIAPRGLGTVSVTPSDNNSASDCTGKIHDQKSCTLTYDRGDRVKLTASSDQGRKLSSWSTPDCPGTGECDLTLDDDVTSIVALFDPLRLGVQCLLDARRRACHRGSGRHAVPAPTSCRGRRITCFEFAPGTKVKLTHDTGGRPRLQRLEPRLRADQRIDVHDHGRRRDDVGGRAVRRRRLRRGSPRRSTFSSS